MTDDERRVYLKRILGTEPRSDADLVAAIRDDPELAAAVLAEIAAAFATFTASLRAMTDAITGGFRQLMNDPEWIGAMARLRAAQEGLDADADDEPDLTPPAWEDGGPSDSQARDLPSDGPSYLRTTCPVHGEYNARRLHDRHEPCPTCHVDVARPPGPVALKLLSVGWFRTNANIDHSPEQGFPDWRDQKGRLQAWFDDHRSDASRGGPWFTTNANDGHPDEETALMVAASAAGIDLSGVR